MQPCGDEPGEVGHVAKEECPHLVRDLPEPVRLDLPRIGRAAADDQLRLALLRDPPDFVVVDQVGVAIDSVAGDRVETTGEVHLEPVRQVAAVVEAEGEDCVPGLETAEVDRHVRLRPSVRLHVRVLGTEERLGPVDRELLDLVDHLAPAVIALARISLGVLVRGHASHGLEHARPGEVLRRDQLDLRPLALELAAEQGGDLPVDVCKTCLAELLERLLGDGHAGSLLSCGRNPKGVDGVSRTWST